MSEPAVLVEPGQNGAVPRELAGSAALTKGDRIFRGIAGAGAASVLAILGLVLLFLVVEAWPALKVAGWDFLTIFEWQLESEPYRFGVASLASRLALMAAGFLFILGGFAVATGRSGRASAVRA